MIIEVMLKPESSELIRHAIQEKGYSLFGLEAFQIGSDLRSSQASLWESWNQLEKDRYLKAESDFRYRRYGRFELQPFIDGDSRLIPLPDAPFYQSIENNPYAGGIAREFAPLEDSTKDNYFLHALIESDFLALPLSTEDRLHSWEIDVHQYRVIADLQVAGEPTPEGIHNDGFDFFAVHLIGRRNVFGGTSTIYNNDKEPLIECTLEHPCDSMLVEDSRVMHGVSPISPADRNQPAVRDVIVINFIRKLRNL